MKRSRRNKRQMLFDLSQGDKKDATGVTFGGQGEPMQVTLQRLRNEGKCFECGRSSHYARQCPKKKTVQTARAIVAELSDELKELLQNKLFAEADLVQAAQNAHCVEVEEVVDESHSDDEDFQPSQ